MGSAVRNPRATASNGAGEGWALECWCWLSAGACSLWGCAAFWCAGGVEVFEGDLEVGWMLKLMCKFIKC